MKLIFLHLLLIPGTLLSCFGQWNSLPLGIDETIHDISFINPDSGFITCEKGIFATTDGGIKWFRQTKADDQHPSRFLAIQFTDDKNGLAAGTEDTIFNTTNGGKTWEGSPSGSLGAFFSSMFKIQNNIYVIGYDGYILKGNIYSDHWAPLEYGTYKNINCIHFCGIDYGFVAGQDGLILKTIDGGKSWETLNSEIKNWWCTSVYFPTSKIGYIAGTYGIIIKTTNMGETWTRQNTGTTADLHSICFSDANNGYAVGEGGTILKTTDGGTTWAIEESKTFNYLVRVYYVGKNIWYIVGGHGTVLKKGSF